jgi:hypothetical protein
MTAKELVRTITNRLKPVKVINDTTIKLGTIFWPVSRSANLAMKFWPELFKKGSDIMSDDRGFINVIRGVLLREDAGLSSDGVPANPAGGGQVDGIGIGARGEPGGVARKKRRIAKLRNPKLFKAMPSEDNVELDLLSDAGQWRFNEGKDGAVDTDPTLPNSPADIDPNPKKSKLKTPSKRSLRRGASEILMNPVIPTRFEDVVAEDRAGGTVRIDYLIRIGLGDVKKINYYRQAIRDPEAPFKNATLRPFVGEVLDQTLDLIFNDAQLYNRFRALLQKQDKTRGENELPEDESDIHERARFARWKQAQQLARAKLL